MIDDHVRRARNESEIFFLLTSYMEALQFGDKKHFISASTIALPLRTTADLQERSTQLFIDLDNASKALDDQACLAMKEALQVFGSALHRLHYLQATDRANNYVPTTNRRHRTQSESLGSVIKGKGVGHELSDDSGR